MSKTNIWGQMSNLFNSVINTVTAALLFLFNRIVNTVKNPITKIPVLSNSNVDNSNSVLSNSDVDKSNSTSTTSEQPEVINSVKKVSTSYSNVDVEEVYIEGSDAPSLTSLTFTMEFGKIRVGGYIVIEGRPCKVTKVTTSKTGKHGSAKCYFIAIDIFTGKKYEEIHPSLSNVQVPNFIRTEYQLIDISEEGFVTLMDEHGNTRDDIKLPTYPETLAEAIKEAFASDEIILVTVCSAMGQEQIISFKKELN